MSPPLPPAKSKILERGENICFRFTASSRPRALKNAVSLSLSLSLMSQRMFRRWRIHADNLRACIIAARSREHPQEKDAPRAFRLTFRSMLRGENNKTAINHFSPRVHARTHARSSSVREYVPEIFAQRIIISRRISRETSSNLTIARSCKLAPSRSVPLSRGRRVWSVWSIWYVKVKVAITLKDGERSDQRG